jgi:hypothetical protein
VILTLHGPPKNAEIFGNASGDFGMLQVLKMRSIGIEGSQKLHSFF